MHPPPPPSDIVVFACGVRGGVGGVPRGAADFKLRAKVSGTAMRMPKCSVHQSAAYVCTKLWSYQRPCTCFARVCVPTLLPAPVYACTKLHWAKTLITKPQTCASTRLTYTRTVPRIPQMFQYAAASQVHCTMCTRAYVHTFFQTRVLFARGAESRTSSLCAFANPLANPPTPPTPSSFARSPSV